MRTSKQIKGRYLGYRDADRAEPYAGFFNPQLAPLPAHAAAALLRGAVPEPLVPGLDGAAAALFKDTAALEDGYVLLPDGGMRVAIRTDMPNVTPAMIDWWFAWHGDAAAKYKLWHPQAHVNAAWAQSPPVGAQGRDAYVGRTSIVDEWIGGDFIRGAIQFVAPEAIGLGDPSLADPSAATIVCARVGVTEAPVNVGVLAHHVRTVPGGAEMRSRFWMGGAHIKPRNAFAGPAAAIARRTLKLTEADARAVLVHCAQEMQHLAGFLPALHAAFA
ncbi:MAG: hypothetical protein EBZ50_05930 [Alphaproteobacteria bacterium]|nr:hypothetical protein [Alphaproteobacteria bacterium]